MNTHDILLLCFILLGCIAFGAMTIPGIIKDVAALLRVDEE